MRRRLLAVLAPVALLAACGPTTSARPTVAGTLPEIATEDEAAQLAALETAPVTEPARLKGLSPIQVKAVLGHPGFTRRDTPAEIWQYRGRACTIDLFLYDEPGGKRVAHVALRNGSGPVDEKACFQELALK
jgi:hypothetical protein